MSPTFSVAEEAYEGRMSFEYTYLYKSISSSNKIEKSAPQQTKARSIFYDIMTGHRRKLITYILGEAADSRNETNANEKASQRKF